MAFSILLGLRQPVTYPSYCRLCAVAGRVRIRGAMTSTNSGELPRPGRLTTARRKSLVIDLLSQGHTLAQVREALGINRVTVYRWRQGDKVFAQAYSNAMEAGTDLIEQEARRRAVEGCDISARPIGRSRARIFRHAAGVTAPRAPARRIPGQGESCGIYDLNHDTRRPPWQRR